MRTSEEIYHRVRWDPRFDPARFVFGVEQRGAPVKRVPLEAFTPGGDVPWHRVLYVEADGERLWDRAAGTDRLDESTAGRVRAPRRLRAPFFVARSPHRWDAVDGWRPVAGAETLAAGSASVKGGAGAEGVDGLRSAIRVLTWNTLWDRYNSELIDTARRRLLLLTALAAADADVIALQEVEPELFGMVLRTSWVRERYVLGTEARGRDTDRSGLMLLSRLPVLEAGFHALGPHKGVMAMSVATAAGPLVFAATHLTSDYAIEGAAKRRGELGRLGDGLAGVEGGVVLVGDFNDSAHSPYEGPAAALGLQDAWAEAHGSDDRTPTFDPATNPLAKIGSTTGRSGRLDRVLLRVEGAAAREARLWGDAPTAAGLFISDHYGVLVDLELNPEAAAALHTARTDRDAERRAQASGVRVEAGAGTEAAAGTGTEEAEQAERAAGWAAEDRRQRDERAKDLGTKDAAESVGGEGTQGAAQLALSQEGAQGAKRVVRGGKGRRRQCVAWA